MVKGRETQGKRTDLLSTIDKKLPEHNTQKELATELGWSTAKIDRRF
jgi:Trp operon repressor